MVRARSMGRGRRSWLGPATHGCGLSDVQASSNSVELDVETMKLALRIIFSEEDQLSGWLKRAPRRPGTRAT